MGSSFPSSGMGNTFTALTQQTEKNILSVKATKQVATQGLP